jgi:hypothetical protein
MREETRKRLDSLETKDILGWVSAFAVLALVCAGVVAFHAAPREEREVAGTVESADWRLNDDTGQTYPYIEVKLDSGSSVRVGSMAPALPAVGERITLRQRAMLFDYMKVYEWDGPAPALSASESMPPAPTPVSHP